MEKTKGQKLQEELVCKFPHIGKVKPEQRKEADAFCEGYKNFLDNGKTERECVREAVAMMEMKGYVLFEEGKTYQAGDKVYTINRNKAILATTFGKEGLDKGLRINGAHIDSPRLDLKPNPLYEKNDVSFLKTHYYGGIRKYQWATIPLAMHGVIVKKNGEVVEVSVGEKEEDPVFCISDLLPHLAAQQNERKLKDGIKGEELNVIVGSIPYVDEAEIKEPVKLLTLQLLNECYGITETDFTRAEIEMVPAHKARDIGFDRSLIGGYGQDDRVCAYTALMAELDIQQPTYTTLTILTDKEEIGSTGNTGLNSDYVLHHIEDLADMAKVNVRKVLRNSICLSSDVNAAYDPTFSEAFEAKNSCFLNKGCVLTKYTGARGKGGCSDASAELMAKVIGMMEDESVYWQTGELGRVDQGGGGTIAQYIAHMDVEVVDLGVPVLSMHSPFEISAKLDIYHTYKAFKAFYK
jgi:aspartyl aminopeptidase